MENPNHRHRRLLRACCERPRGCRAAEKRDEFAALHSITSSARNKIDVGTDTPIALAVFKLSTNSKLVGCSTGRSDGFAPLRILATNDAARRTIGTVSMPYDISPPACKRMRTGNTVARGFCLPRQALCPVWAANVGPESTSSMRTPSAAFL